MAACRRKVIIHFISLLAVALPCSAAKVIRGTDPQYKSEYDPPDGKFTCLDGSKTIPANHINDAFCDCVDGSDEPGTSACPNGKFYCANIGSEPLRLNSSFVDDGICDCCDGSDEAQGRCKNTCKEAGAAALAALQAELAAFEAGYNARATYLKAAEDLRREWKSRIDQIAQEYSPSEIKSNELGAERDRLQKQLEAYEAKKNKLEAALAPPPTPQPTADDTTDVATTEQAQTQDAVVENADEVDAATDRATAGGIDDQAIAQESAEDIAKRVASQWIPGASDKGSEEQQPEEEEPVDYNAEEHGADEESDDRGDVYEPSLDALATLNAAEDSGEGDGAATDQEQELLELDLGPMGRFKAWIAETFAKLLGKTADAAELQRLRATVDAIRSRYEASKTAFEVAAAGVYALKSEREGLETKLNRSYGPDDVYAQLVDRCVEAHVDKYTYRVCPFNDAQQLEDGSGPRLGSWKGFGESGDHMIFDNGEGCWQGPNRSMTVRIRCGATETLTKVAEPSRCEYTAEMTTPAACSEDRVKELRAEIAARQAWLDASNAKDEL